MLKVMFFDLDGTLWDSKHPLLQTAWDRLPKAWERVVGKLPDDFDWSKLAGSTDYAVVKTLVDDQFPKKSSQEKRELIQQTIIAMNDYYLSNAPDDIRPALFDDTVRGLKSLKESGWTLGIITGNTKTVAFHKLSAAGLLELFTTDERFLFFGDTAHSRSFLIENAWVQQMLEGVDGENIPPLVYVADTLRDFKETKEAMWQLADKFLSFELKVLLREQPAIYSKLQELSRATNPMSFLKVSWSIFDKIGDWNFCNIVNAEGSTKYRRIEIER